MTQHVEINQTLIRDKMIELKLTMGMVENKAGMAPCRMSNLMKRGSKYKMKLDEAHEISKLLNLPLNEIVKAYVEVGKRGRKIGSRNIDRGPKPFQPRPAYPDKQSTKPVIRKFLANSDTIRQRAKEAKANFAKLCRENGLNPEYISSRLSRSESMFTIEMLDLIAKNLKCSIADISNIPVELNVDYTEVTSESPNLEVKQTTYWVEKSEGYPDPKLDPRYRNNPVIQTRRKLEQSGLENWKKLPETARPKENFYIADNLGGDRLAFRVENGNAVIYAVRYIPREVLIEACEQVKAWGNRINGGERK